MSKKNFFEKKGLFVEWWMTMFLFTLIIVEIIHGALFFSGNISIVDQISIIGACLFWTFAFSLAFNIKEEYISLMSFGFGMALGLVLSIFFLVSSISVGQLILSEKLAWVVFSIFGVSVSVFEFFNLKSGAGFFKSLFWLLIGFVGNFLPITSFFFGIHKATIIETPFFLLLIFIFFLFAALIYSIYLILQTKRQRQVVDEEQMSIQ